MTSAKKGAPIVVLGQLAFKILLELVKFCQSLLSDVLQAKPIGNHFDNVRQRRLSGYVEMVEDSVEGPYGKPERFGGFKKVHKQMLPVVFGQPENRWLLSQLPKPFSHKVKRAGVTLGETCRNPMNEVYP